MLSGDGGESDLDLGNYERFLNIELCSDHNLTTGKIYRQVILDERKGKYLGKTVQVVPHITDAIISWIQKTAMIPVRKVHKENEADGDKEELVVADVCLIEVGGTVGDIESSVFLEALRQFQFRCNRDDNDDSFCLCFVSLVPVLSTNEQKTKPTQHGVRDLRSLGLTPSIIFCRSQQPLLDSTKQKISDFCHVPALNVLSVHDVNNVYHVPQLLAQQNLHVILQQALQLHTISDPQGIPRQPQMQTWNDMAHSVDEAESTVKIALIGKYTGLQDSYLSVIKALRHASIAANTRLHIDWVEASMLEESNADNGEESNHSESLNGEAGGEQQERDTYETAWKKIKEADGVIVPGGFGQRGWEGKLLAANYCRTNGKPYLGVCLGFQAMVVEYCREVLGWKGANSTEIAPDTPHPTIVFMPEIDKETMGGTMRLGSRVTKFFSMADEKISNGGIAVNDMSMTQLMYNGASEVWERHRHRYEVNPEKVDEIHKSGLKLIGRDETGERMEVAELPVSDHPYYVGCQFHPEFKSRPLQPSPPFHGLILAATGQLTGFLEKKRQTLSK